MSSVAGIPDGSSPSQPSVWRWLQEQAQYMPSGTTQHVLTFLAMNAFRSTDNPEGGEIGQVYESYSSLYAICRGTAIKSRESVRNALLELQRMAYVQREPRESAPNNRWVFYVHWEASADQRREDMRAGKTTLSEAFTVVPPAPKIRDPKPVLTLVSSN